jgi:hypothetical protein
VAAPAHTEDETPALRVLTDFDCPACSANNPLDDPLSDGVEVRCYFCGLEFKVSLGDDGRPTFKEI